MKLEGRNEYPIVDLSDCSHSRLSGIRIQGDAAGSQICGVLHGMVGSTLALQNILDNVIIAGTNAKAAYINHSADLAKIHHSYLEGPCGAILTTDKDACGSGIIRSAYQTLTTTPNVTLINFEGSQVIGKGGDSRNYSSAIVFYEIMKITIDAATYIAQDGSAKAGIYVYGVSGSLQECHEIEFRGRYENQTDAPQPDCFVWVAAQEGIKNCIFEGFIGANGQAPDIGQWFYLESGSIYKSRIALNPGGAGEWAHVVQRAASTNHTIYDCEIIERMDPGNLLDGIDAALFGPGNKFHIHQFKSAWLGVASPSEFLFSDIGALSLNKFTGFNAIGTTAEMVRKYIGHLSTDVSNYQPTGTGSEETIYSYALPGDICYASDALRAASMRFCIQGYFAANANAKTLRVRFGRSGSEQEIIINDTTTAPNGSAFIVECEILRITSGEWWGYACKMFIGNTLQSVKQGLVSADPASYTVRILVTATASASGDVIQGVTRIQLF